METVNKAICLVAHPDDCIIFGMAYIINNPQWSWSIGYLTYTEQEPRAQEISKFWQRRGITTIFLGYEDDWRDQQRQEILAWDTSLAQQDLCDLANRFDLVLTHDSQGDYGHIHHRLVHDSVKSHPNLVTFAPPGQGNLEYQVQRDSYDMHELPLHAEMIKNFHPTQHRNCYRSCL